MTDIDGEYNERIRQQLDRYRNNLYQFRPPVHMPPPYRGMDTRRDAALWDDYTRHDPVCLDDLARNRPGWPT